jgi:hypothetical protein
MVRELALPGAYFENRIFRCDPLEIRQRRIFVHRYVRSRARCSLEVGFHDRPAEFDGNLFEVNFLTTARTQDHVSTRRPRVADPLYVFSKHRHQVPLPIDDSYDHWQRGRPPRFSTRYFQGHQVVGNNSRRGNGSGCSIQHPRDPIGSLATV